MKCNVGGLDRKVRLGAGILILGAGLLAQSWWGLIGLIPLATALCRSCPVYSLINVSTCDSKKGSCCCGKPAAKQEP